MDTLERVHIRLTRRQLNFIKQHYGNLSQWVRNKIEREIGAEEARVIDEIRQGPPVGQKIIPPKKAVVWNFPK